MSDTTRLLYTAAACAAADTTSLPLALKSNAFAPIHPMFADTPNLLGPRNEAVYERLLMAKLAGDPMDLAQEQARMLTVVNHTLLTLWPAFLEHVAKRNPSVVRAYAAEVGKVPPVTDYESARILHQSIFPAHVLEDTDFYALSIIAVATASRAVDALNPRDADLTDTDRYEHVRQACRSCYMLASGMERHARDLEPLTKTLHMIETMVVLPDGEAVFNPDDESPMLRRFRDACGMTDDDFSLRGTNALPTDTVWEKQAELVYKCGVDRFVSIAFSHLGLSQPTQPSLQDGRSWVTAMMIALPAEMLPFVRACGEVLNRHEEVLTARVVWADADDVAKSRALCDRLVDGVAEAFHVGCACHLPLEPMRDAVLMTLARAAVARPASDA
jgi:hypothetical protein